MATAHRGNTPLWFDLLLATGVVGAAYAVERYVMPRPPDPRGNGTVPSTEKAGHDGSAAEREDRATRSSPGGKPARDSRSYEPGRGRNATAPQEIPVKGWMDVGWRVYAQLTEDRVLAVAGGVVFYLILALFPALASLVSLYGLFTDPSTITSQLSLLEGILPVSTIAIIHEQVTQLASTSSGSLSFGFLAGLGLAMWSANAGMKAIIDALNVVYDEPEKRSFVHLTLVAFAFTVGGLVFIILSIGAIVVVPLVLAWIGLESRAAQIISWARWPALFVIVLVWLTVLYRFGPSRTRARWQWLSVGAVLATVAWLAASILFSWYLANFANYDATYGSLGAGIGLMMWLWMSVIVILVGGELNAELEHQTVRDTTIRPDQRLGDRGAVMADTVGEAWR